MTENERRLEPISDEEFQRITTGISAEFRALMKSTGLAYVLLQCAPTLDGTPQLDVQTNMPDARALTRLYLITEDDDADFRQVTEDPPQN